MSAELPVSTATLYDRENGKWQRTTPTLLSDFTARPFLLDWCDPVAGCNVLDLGCGEGYFARQLKPRGAKRLAAVDVSSAMIDAAQAAEDAAPLGIEFGVGDSTDLSRFATGAFDLVVAVFMFNYLTLRQTTRALAEIHRVLAPGGRLVFAVPHPSLAFLRPEEPPFYFTRNGAGYFTGRDQQFEGMIQREDGTDVPVRCVHKTFADYFSALRTAGFDALPEIEELRVRDDDLARNPQWFGPLADQPLHLAFRLRRGVT